MRSTVDGCWNRRTSRRLAPIQWLVADIRMPLPGVVDDFDLVTHFFFGDARVRAACTGLPQTRRVRIGRGVFRIPLAIGGQIRSPIRSYEPRIGRPTMSSITTRAGTKSAIRREPCSASLTITVRPATNRTMTRSTTFNRDFGRVSAPAVCSPGRTTSYPPGMGSGLPMVLVAAHLFPMTRHEAPTATLSDWPWYEGF